MEPLTPRVHDPAADVCVMCSRPWRGVDPCTCGETQGDVLDLEHALSAGATMEAKGVLR